jgi:hypothetical protein
MPGNFSQLENLISRVGKREGEMRDTTALHFPLVADYEGKAKRLAEVTLRALKPADVDKAAWGLRVASLVRAVRATVIEGGIYLTLEPEGSPDSRAADVDFREIEDWIQAGLDGKGGDAKRISAEDRRIMAEYGEAKGKRIIATKVARAYYSGNPKANYMRMRRAIHSYLSGNVAEEGSAAMLDAVLAAWKQGLAAGYKADMGRNLKF